MRELRPKSDMSLVEATAARTVDVGAAARSLVGKVDVIYTNNYNNVVSACEAFVKVRNSAKIPLIASDTDSVKRGAIAALGEIVRAHVWTTVTNAPRVCLLLLEKKRV